jgi:hypothetical protein
VVTIFNLDFCEKEKLKWPLKDLGQSRSFLIIALFYMTKHFFILLFFVLISCYKNEINSMYENGTVLNITSCGGGEEPVFIIKINDDDSIMTATLSKEFQIPNLKIKFKRKESSFSLYCTDDKIYPPAFDVFDVKNE